jgi:hypothetical protein
MSFCQLSYYIRKIQSNILFAYQTSNSMNERKTITISRKAFEKLRTLGTFGESYNDLVLRLMDELESKVEIQQR